MKIYDITLPISEALEVYPGDPAVNLERVKDIANGDSFTLSKISMSSHTGTHVDAPSHLFADGRSADELSLDTMIGLCQVIHIPDVSKITIAHLEYTEISEEIERVLIETDNTKTYIEKDAAHWLVERGVKLIGINTMSVDSADSESLDAHKILLKAGVIILENLYLETVEPGMYTLICLPLKIKGGDGAPARVILVEDASFL